MEFKIVLKDDVYDQIETIMHYTKELVDGNEIGAWLCGEWNTEGNLHTLLLDRLIIPKQKVSKTEVDINPEHLIDMINEFGIAVTNRVKAHWHEHPFGDGMPSWSGGDVQKFNEWMNPDTNREIFVFLLSSFDTMKARVELNLRTQFRGQTIIFKKSIDDLQVHRENPKPTPLNPYFETLKTRIESKVEKPTYKVETLKYPSGTNWAERDEKLWKSQTQTKEEDYVINKHGNRVHLKLTREFAGLIENCDVPTKLLHTPNSVKGANRSHPVWKYACDGDFRTTEEIAKQLKEDIDEVKHSLIMEEMENTRGNLGDKVKYGADSLFPYDARDYY